MAQALKVYLFEHHVGSLSREAGKLSFSYQADWLTLPHARPLSCSLPLQAEPFNDDQARPFFAGLLPEGELRKLLSRQFQLSDANAFGLLNEIGGECAGAVTFLENHQSLPKTGTQDRHWLSESELSSVLDELPRRPMMAGEQGLRLSLAGAQDKLPVVVENGKIGLALNGTPSTHILKSAIDSLHDSVINEAYCLALARSIGLTAANSSVSHAGHHQFLLVERYDRQIDTSGSQQRLHQEDFCQALGRPSESKYQHEGGPDLSDCFALIRRVVKPSAPAVLRFVDYTVFNFLIGNHDAHAKNFSLLYSQNKPTLAPLYDALSTAVYTQLTNKMAMKLGSQYTFKGVMPRHWEQFANDNGLAWAQLRKRLQLLATRLPGAARDLLAQPISGAIHPSPSSLKSDGSRSLHADRPRDTFAHYPVAGQIQALIGDRCETSRRRLDR